MSEWRTSPEVVDGAKDGAKKVGDGGKGALEATRPVRWRARQIRSRALVSVAWHDAARE